MTKGSDFEMRLINHTKYKVNSMRLTNNMRLTTRVYGTLSGNGHYRVHCVCVCVHA